MAESIAAGTETVPRHRGPHYLCPQCRDINPLHLNARRARSTYSSRFPSTARAPRRSGEKSQKVGRRRRKKYEERPHFTSPCIRGPLGFVVRSQSRATCPGILGDKWRSSGSSSAFGGRARILQASSTYSK